MLNVRLKQVWGSGRRWLSIVSAETRKDHVSVKFSDGRTSNFHFVWLRDHCPSSKSRDATTLQRLHATGDLDLNVKPSKVVGAESELELTWPASKLDADGHVSRFEVDFLRSHAYWGDEGDEDVVEVVWKPWESGMKPPVFEAEAILSDDVSVGELLRRMQDPGVAVVEGCEASEAGTQRLVERIGHLRRTFYGDGMWRTEVRADGNDTAYQAIALPPHTDGNYFDSVPGLQVFQCLKPAVEGGQTVLVDGAAVADRLKRKFPDAFHFLSVTQLPFAHRDPNTSMIAWRPVFSLAPNGRLQAFHFNNDDRATCVAKARQFTPSYSPETFIPALYKHLQPLLHTIRDPKLHFTTNLRPGSVLLMNNQRVMHGRSAFDPSSGRVLTGCYVSKDVWEGRLRAIEAAAKGGNRGNWII